MRGVPMNAEEPGHHHRHRLCAGEPPPPVRRPSLSGLVKQNQHLSRQLISTTSTVAALQAETASFHALVKQIALENQRLRRTATVWLLPDEEVAASPALLQMLRDQLTRLEKVQEVGHEVAVEAAVAAAAAAAVDAAAAVTTAAVDAAAYVADAAAADAVMAAVASVSAEVQVAVSVSAAAAAAAAAVAALSAASPELKAAKGSLRPPPTPLRARWCGAHGCDRHQRSDAKSKWQVICS